jgi:hypothetical protein
LKSLERLKTVLSDVEINEDQKAALDAFLIELSETLAQKAEAKYQGQIKDLELQLESKGTTIDPKEYISISEAEAAFNLAMQDAEKAFYMVQEDVIAESSEIMSKTIEDIYEDLKIKAQEEAIKSPQFEALNKIKEILTPSIISEASSDSLAKKVKELESQLTSIAEEKEVLEREKIIESLVSELPKKEAKIVRNYIEEAKSIDDVYERFNLALALLEAKEDSAEPAETKDPEDEEDEDLEEEVDEEEEMAAESIISEEMVAEVKEEKKRKKFTSIDEAIIAGIWN